METNLVDERAHICRNQTEEILLSVEEMLGYTYMWTPFGRKVHELIPVSPS